MIITKCIIQLFVVFFNEFIKSIYLLFSITAFHMMSATVVVAVAIELNVTEGIYCRPD